MMRLGNSIYNLDGLPFKSETAATRMRDLLAGESGKSYSVENFPDGGFVLVDATPVEHGLGNGQPVTMPDETVLPLNRATAKAGQSQAIKLRPAVFRTNLDCLGLMLVAATFILSADAVAGLVLTALNTDAADSGDWHRGITTAMVSLGSIALVGLWSVLMWQRACSLYLVTEFGVEARQGIIAQQSVGLRFQDIRSMSIKQSVTDRLLNVGLLEFTSAGSDGIPVRFMNIANPNKVLEWVKSRMTLISSED